MLQRKRENALHNDATKTKQKNKLSARQDESLASTLLHCTGQLSRATMHIRCCKFMGIGNSTASATASLPWGKKNAN